MFNKEELIALKNMVVYASENISIEDEPLIDILYEKIKEFILSSELVE